MKEIIMKFLSYDIYVWLISGFIIALGIGITVFSYLKALIINYIQRQKERHQQQEILSTKTQNKEISIIIEEENTSEPIGQVDLGDIAQKLLQSIEVETVVEEIVSNKLEEQERERHQDMQKDNDNLNGIETIVTKDSSNGPEEAITQTKITQTQTTVEVYNTKTNLESINKQKTRFELLKHEVESIKTRGQRVDYEKKLIEATIDFPDDEYFNTLLGDRYIENGDYKKAQTIYKKLHFLNEFDDKSLYKLGIINLELGDIQAAEYLLTKAKDIKPENPKYYQLLAEVKYNMEKIDECIELMEKAVDLRPTKFEYIEILGKLYKETNNVQLYYKTLLKMNALEPMNQKVRSELGKLQE